MAVIWEFVASCLAVGAVVMHLVGAGALANAAAWLR
jgi:hypothetical protein